MKCFVDFAPGKPDVLGKFNGGFKPKFCLSILTLNMDVHSRFFTREEIKTEAIFSKNRRTHLFGALDSFIRQLNKTKLATAGRGMLPRPAWKAINLNCSPHEATRNAGTFVPQIPVFRCAPYGLLACCPLRVTG